MASCSLEYTTSKGGYDYDFVSPPPKSLECPVCLLTLRDPHVISCCGNEFCQVCIERVQRDGKPCPLCNEPKFTTFLHKKLVREVNALVVRCPQKELGCEWEDELGQLQSHLNLVTGVATALSKGCDFVMVECPYQCGAQLQRRLLHEHEVEICPKRPIEMQVASLMWKFETITVENQQLRQELEKMQKMHTEEMNQVKQELNELKQKNEHLQKVNRDMQLKSDDLEKKCVSLPAHTMPLPVPPFYFSLYDVSHYQSNSLVYHSETFYSHPGGYKMKMRVRPNGLSSYTGTHMGIYIAIVRGEFDDQLCWPFDGSVTVHIYNRTMEQWSNEYTIKLNEKQCGLERVKKCVDTLSNYGWGRHCYVSISELKKDYAKDVDVVRFRVTNVKCCNHQ